MPSRMQVPTRFALLLMALGTSVAYGSVTIVEVSYPPSDRPGELVYAVTYRAWLPDGVARLRGVVVHQHGCGAGASKGVETAADDLHWQALDRKWGYALLGPSYKQEDGQDCRRWYDPRTRRRLGLVPPPQLRPPGRPPAG